ncbi:reverse transcriptase domain-containing protein [Flavobacterium johnsoniae]|uniref:reverse transcriptase domain-containing protein n=1 Tax=Flavobacterium johnsoniae TaxID=986 RepID=UPI003D9713B9
MEEININKFLELEYLKKLFHQKIKRSKSKGIDKVSVEKFDVDLDNHLNLIIDKFKSGSYNFSPYLELLKLKGRNKVPRVISIPTIRDKLVLLVLKEILHEAFDSSVNRKLPNNYIKEIKHFLKKDKSEKFFLKLDLEKFYDTLNHDIIISKLTGQNLPENVVLLIKRAITNITVPQNSHVSQYANYEANVGVPQGLSISNILAQIYLLDFDKVISKRKYFYQRYVDDILLINSSEISQFRIKNFIKELESLSLAVNSSKTEQNSLNVTAFNFLSYSISDDKISVAQKNIELFLRRIAAKITWFKSCIKVKEKRPEHLKENPERLKEVFINELNDMITGLIANNKSYGWLFYFSEINDLDLLFKIDKIISSFFLNIDAFNNNAPQELKRLVRTYYAINSKKLNYISNYDKLDTVIKKREFLVYRGQISSTQNYSNEDIERHFIRYQNKQIRRNEQGLGYTYIT